MASVEPETAADPSADPEAVQATEQIRRLQDELDMERICHAGLRALMGALMDEATAHPDRDGHPLVHDQDQMDAIYRWAVRSAARKMGREALLYATGADYHAARNRLQMERQARIREARHRLTEIARTITDLEATAADLRERLFTDTVACVRWAGLRQRSYLGRRFANRRAAEIAKDRHLAYLEDQHRAALARIDALRREERRTEAVASGWTA
jgi:hypothetical protein